MNALLLVLVFLSGAGLPIQAASNARLRTVVDSPLLSAVVSFLVGLSVLLVLYACGVLGRGRPSAMLHAPWWSLTGGFIGATIVALSLIAVPRVGTGALVAAMVCGQLIMAVIMDHFGLLGLQRVSINGWRIAGAVLLLGGVFLMQKR